MSAVNEVMDDLESENKYIMVDGKPTSIKEVLDSILSDKKEKKREISEG